MDVVNGLRIVIPVCIVIVAIIGLLYKGDNHK